MVYLFKIEAPGSDLDGETFTVQSPTVDDATIRAESHLSETFCYASECTRRSAQVVLVASYASASAYIKARDAAFDAGVTLGAR